MKVTTKRHLQWSAGLGLGLLLLTNAQADRGRIRWSGDVDDRAEISIRGGRVWVDRQNRKGVANEHAQVMRNMPLRRSMVSLSREDGRGQVRLVQQPRPENDYTAIVRIIDTQSGRGHYAFTVRWEDRSVRYGR